MQLVREQNTVFVHIININATSSRALAVWTAVTMWCFYWYISCNILGIHRKTTQGRLGRLLLGQLTVEVPCSWAAYRYYTFRCSNLGFKPLTLFKLPFLFWWLNQTVSALFRHCFLFLIFSWPFRYITKFTGLCSNSLFSMWSLNVEPWVLFVSLYNQFNVNIFSCYFSLHILEISPKYL